ncbi:hypothetical protein YPPY56_3727, partial [Yersinia pestis PY-56]
MAIPEPHPVPITAANTHFLPAPAPSV